MRDGDTTSLATVDGGDFHIGEPILPPQAPITPKIEWKHIHAYINASTPQKRSRHSKGHEHAIDLSKRSRNLFGSLSRPGPSEAMKVTSAYASADESMETLDDMLRLMKKDGGCDSGGCPGRNVCEYYHVSVTVIQKLKAHIGKTTERERLQMRMHEAVLNEVEDLRGIVTEHEEKKRVLDQLWGELKV